MEAIERTGGSLVSQLSYTVGGRTYVDFEYDVMQHCHGLSKHNCAYDEVHIALLDNTHAR